MRTNHVPILLATAALLAWSAAHAGAPLAAAQLDLRLFGIATITACVPVTDDETLCRANATRLPALAAGESAMPLASPVAVSVAVNRRAGVQEIMIDIGAISRGERDALNGLGREVERQLSAATKCTDQGAPLEMWRAGPAFVILNLSPTGDFRFEDTRIEAVPATAFIFATADHVRSRLRIGTHDLDGRLNQLPNPRSETTARIGNCTL